MTDSRLDEGRGAQMWGGRFKEGPNRILWDFTVDHSDRRLLADDVFGSLAHVTMLGKVGLLSDQEVKALTKGLEAIGTEADEGTFQFEEKDEDVHSAVERRLGELVGEVAAKLHTGRSRNDQVALDMRLYLMRSADRRISDLKRFGRILVKAAREAGDLVVSGYTHLQQAQAVPLAHHLLAYAWAINRDQQRFDEVHRRLRVSPLGAGALGGSSLPLDPTVSARYLGLEDSFANSMDAVGARDHIAEYGFAATQALVHLSRLAEECVLWASHEFRWVTFGDALTTGSSAMPHKKNPDIAELTRGKAAIAIGHLTGLMALQKGLPTTYNRDFQEDKAAVFAIDDALAGSLKALGALIDGAVFHPPGPDPSVTALDLAEVLVERGVPFREAHRAVGRLFGSDLNSGQDVWKVTYHDLAAAHSSFRPEDVALTEPVKSVARRRSAAGGSFSSVQEQLRRLDELLA
ncbi:MAG: argininosuccinate lyase [bacterium]|nr:argininosuccinate lyase [bacterium]